LVSLMPIMLLYIISPFVVARRSKKNRLRRL
jgi:hypothetical protein